MQNIISQITTCVSNKQQQTSLLKFISDSENAVKVPKIFVLYGKGCNGKSTLINKLLAHFNNACIIIPKTTSYALSMLLQLSSHRKLVIIHGMEPNEKLAKTTVNSILRAKCFYTGPVCINNTANYMLCINELDALQDLSDDMYEVITFDKIFNSPTEITNAKC